MKKRGISPLIASVLLVGLVVVASSLVMLWSKSYVEEVQQKEGKIAAKTLSCATDIEINVLDVSSGYVTVENIGSGDISAFSIVIEGSGETETKEVIQEVKPGDSSRISYIVQGSTITPEKIIIIPKLTLGSRLGPFQPCSDKRAKVEV